MSKRAILCKICIFCVSSCFVGEVNRRSNFMCILCIITLLLLDTYNYRNKVMIEDIMGLDCMNKNKM